MTNDSNRMSLLNLLEISQSAVKSSDKALRAAEEALSAAQIAHSEVKTMLQAVTEAFVLEDRKLRANSEESEGYESLRTMSSVECETEDDSDDMEDFVMLSTNKNPIKDIEEEVSEDKASPNFLLLSSTGPAADHRGQMLGVYHKSQEKREEKCVYMQEETVCGKSLCVLFSDQGFWAVTNLINSHHILAATPSLSPTSCSWQFYNSGSDMIRNDQNLRVTGLKEKPSVECEITISLGEDVMRNIEDRGLVGVYRTDGDYCHGRPVFLHSGGQFCLYVSAQGRWWVSHLDGVSPHIVSGSAPSMCPADPRAARNERWVQTQTRWRFKGKQGILESCGYTITCCKHK